MAKQSSEARWEPSANQLKDPQSLERAFREVLRLHYQTADELRRVKEENIKNNNGTVAPTGQQGWNTMVMGLPVDPIDANTLANGATLKYVAATRSFKFS